MKKSLIGVIAAVSVLSASAAHATVYSNTATFSSGNVLSGTGTFGWDQAMPADFQIPYDTVNSSSLEVTARRATDGNDVLSVINFSPVLGALMAGSGNSAFTTTFNLVDIGLFNASWNTGEPIHLSLAYNQPGGANNTLTMVSSTLTLDYTNVDAPGRSVPEPTSIALLGLGLAGLFLGRKRIGKRA